MLNADEGRGQLLAGRAGITLITNDVTRRCRWLYSSLQSVVNGNVEKKEHALCTAVHKVHVPTHTYIQECICRWGFPACYVTEKSLPTHHWANNIGPRPPPMTHIQVPRRLTFWPHSPKCPLQRPASRKHDIRASSYFSVTIRYT
jgi:hypothetical protein